MSYKTPFIINFPEIGDSKLGYISIAEEVNLPFSIKRLFWAFFTPDSVIRGRHAHHETEMILIAVSGKIIVTTEMPGESPQTFILDHPNKGIFLPKYCWHTMQYSHNSVQVCLASKEYVETDYIRDYADFQKLEKLL